MKKLIRKYRFRKLIRYLEKNHNRKFLMFGWNTCVIGCMIKEKKIPMTQSTNGPVFRGRVGWRAIAHYFKIEVVDACFMLTSNGPIYSYSILKRVESIYKKYGGSI